MRAFIPKGDDCEAFMGGIEVGTRKDWAQNHKRPCSERGKSAIEELGWL